MSAVILRPPVKATAPKWYTSQAAEEFRQVVTGKGVLNKLRITNVNAAARNVWVFDNTASSGTVLLAAFQIPIAGFVDVDLRYGLPFSTGLRLAASSTLGTFTGSGTADLIITASYLLTT